jgi:broad-specificity NMP kinase
MIPTYQYYEEIKEILKKRGYDTEKVHPTNYIKK